MSKLFTLSIHRYGFEGSQVWHFANEGDRESALGLAQWMEQEFGARHTISGIYKGETFAAGGRAVPPGLVKLIQCLAGAGVNGRVMAIKAIREAVSCGLKEAKDCVDAIYNDVMTEKAAA
jgi:ribosomal protein L7/L12